MEREESSSDGSFKIDDVIASLRDCVDALSERCTSSIDPSYISNCIETGQLGKIADKLFAARAIRDRYLPADLLAEPGWDMLLYLYASHAKGKRVCVSSCCYASGVPSTTALRWINLLEAHGMIRRYHDEKDTRRRIVELSPEGRDKMTMLLRRMAGFAGFEF